MKFNININQLEIVKNNYEIDVIDACILDFCLDFSHSNKISTVSDKGIIYYWFDYKNIAEQMPILNLKKDSIYRRMKKMSEIGFLLPHPNNQELGRPYYAITQKLLSLRFSAPPTDENPNPYGSQSAPPTDENPNDYNIINNNKTNSSGETPAEQSPAVSFLSKSFKKWTKEEFTASIKAAREKRKAEPQKPNFTTEMLTAFFAYWSEPDAAGKMRFQKQDTWATANRLVTWEQRDKN